MAGAHQLVVTSRFQLTVHHLQGLKRPAGRLGQSSVVLKDPSGRSQLVVFGGRAADDELRFDTWALQLPQALTQAA